MRSRSQGGDQEWKQEEQFKGHMVVQEDMTMAWTKVMDKEAVRGLIHNLRAEFTGVGNNTVNLSKVQFCNLCV